MNSIILVGRLTKDPQVRYIGEKGIPVAEFRVAVDRNNQRDGKYQNTDFINIQAWRDGADISIRKLKKGSLVTIIGSLRIEEFHDKEGKKQYMTKVSTSNIQLLQQSKKIVNGDEIFSEPNSIDEEKVALPF